MKRDSRSSARADMAVLVLGVSLAIGGFVDAVAATGSEESTIQAPARHGSRHHGGRSLEDRVTMLTKALDLDARQQSELRKVLEDQREQISRIWNDTSVPAANRVGITQVISDKTADQIRALLNEEQRKKYNPPKPPHETARGSARPDVEAWMNPAKPK